MKSFKEFLFDSVLPHNEFKVKYPDGKEDELVDKDGKKYIIQRFVIQDREGNPRNEYEVRPVGKDKHTWTIASCQMTGKKDQMMSLSVKPEYRGTGIASAMYDYAEKDMGVKLKPNNALTQDGKEFWKNRNKAK